jgi:hypothetical protein
LASALLEAEAEGATLADGAASAGVATAEESLALQEANTNVQSTKIKAEILIHLHVG